MKGNNTLRLCEAEMLKAVDLYLKQEVFKDDQFIVADIDLDRVSDEFVIQLEGTS